MKRRTLLKTTALAIVPASFIASESRKHNRRPSCECKECWPTEEETRISLAFLDHLIQYGWVDVTSSTWITGDKAEVQVDIERQDHMETIQLMYELERCFDPGPKGSIRHNIYEVVGQPWKVLTIKEPHWPHAMGMIDDIPLTDGALAIDKGLMEQ